MVKWVTIPEASDILGLSERTIFRQVSEGKLEAKTEGNKRFVKIDIDDKTNSDDMTMSDKNATIRWLKNELEERNRQIEQLQTDIKNNRERSDAIIMKLTEELESQRHVFEGHPPKKRDESFWSRFGKKEDK